MFASVFEVLIVKPIFNLLVLIYAILPGHNFGLALIIFTVVVRFLMWPLVRKQLHQAKAMRSMQPEIKRIKADAKGDRQKESLMLMELYKERQINPFGSFGLIIVQFIILIGLYQGLRKVIVDPHAIITYSYSWLRNMSWLQSLSANIRQFDSTLFGFVDLTKSAAQPGGGFYIPALLIVIGSAITQYYSSKQLMPSDKDARKLRHILKSAGDGKNADQSEINAAVGRSTRFLIPGMILIFTIGIASALSLYWLVSGLTAYLQQARILKEDETDMEKIADKSAKKKIIEGEVINNPAASARASKAKRRKK